MPFESVGEFAPTQYGDYGASPLKGLGLINQLGNTQDVAPESNENASLQQNQDQTQSSAVDPWAVLANAIYERHSNTVTPLGQASRDEGMLNLLK